MSYYCGTCHFSFIQRDPCSDFDPDDLEQCTCMHGPECHAVT